MNSYDWQQNLPQEPAPSPLLPAAEAAEGGRRKIARLFGDHLNAVMIAVLILLQIVVPLVTAGVRNPLTPDYILNTTLSVSSTLIAWYMFLPNGRRDRAGLADYVKATEKWQIVTRRITEGGALPAFRDFCRTAAVEEQKRTIGMRLLMLENAGITQEAFFNVWQGTPRGRLRAARRHGELTKEQYDLILLCRRPVPVRSISPNMILHGTAGDDAVGTTSKAAAYERRAKIMKPALCLLWVVAVGFFFPERREGVETVELITNIVIRIFCVCMAVFSGYRTGFRTAEYTKADMDARVTFMELFLQNDAAGRTTDRRDPDDARRIAAPAEFDSARAPRSG